MDNQPKVYAWAVLRESVDYEYKVFFDVNDAFEYAYDEVTGEEYEVIELIAGKSIPIKNA